MRETLARMADARIAVIGDFVLDRFSYGISTRISREAPVLILRHRHTQEVLGGGANTVANVRALGATVYAIGVVGDDAEGRTMRDLFDQAGITGDQLRLLTIPGWPTTSKARILGGLAHSTMQQIVRIDRDDPLPADDPTVAEKLAAHLTEIWPLIDACIVSDYGIGVVREALIETLRTLRRQRPIIVTVDSRYALANFSGMTSMTPNISEVEAALGIDRLDGEHLDRHGSALCARLALDALLVTRGKFGMTLFQPSRSPVHIPCFGSDQVADVTGAGDTVIAAYSTALAANAPFEIAARLANVAGGLKVMKRGTATISAAEITHALDAARPE